MRDLSAWWMPFTANRNFKESPRLLVSAEGMHYRTDDGRRILDGTAGLWCVNAGHAQKRITEAICDGARTPRLRADVPDGPSERLRTRERLVDFTGNKFSQVFYHELRIRGGRHRAEDGARVSPRPRRRHAHAADRPRARLSRRRLRRHLGRRHGEQPQVVRLAADRRRPSCRTRTTSRATRSRRGVPAHGAELADRLEGIVALHDASTIAAVIVEPVAGSTGVLVPPARLPETPARDLHEARHPADLRRGHHRLRPPRHAVRDRLLRRRARPDDGRQGHHQRLRADGRGVRQAARPRRVHARPGRRDRVLPRLHVFRPSARLRRRAGDARRLRRDRRVRQRGRDAGDARGRPARAAGPAVT